MFKFKRPLCGALWLAAWSAVLWAFVSPWRFLGGLEPELLRWEEWWALSAGVALGCTMGGLARNRVLERVGHTHASTLRTALYLPAVVTAVALVALSISGEEGPAGVVATAFLSYWAGLDVGFGAVPLLEGKSYAFARPLDPEEADDDALDEDRDGREGWDRF